MSIRPCHFGKNSVVLLIFLASIKAYSCDFFIEFCLNICSEPKSISDNDIEQELLCEFTDSNIFENLFYESDFGQVPKEIFEAISGNIDRFQDAVNLSRVSKKYRLRSIEFWENFLKENMLIKWNSHIPAIKIAYAYKLFEDNNIYLAAKLGLPQAISLRKAIEKRSERNYCPPALHTSGLARIWY